jgi:hypothetical protein
MCILCNVPDRTDSHGILASIPSCVDISPSTETQFSERKKRASETQETCRKFDVILKPHTVK